MDFLGEFPERLRKFSERRTCREMLLCYENYFVTKDS